MIKRWLHRARRLRRKKPLGQSLVEFTVLLPLLVMMVSGLIEFGFMLNYYLDMIDAAREAARFAADDDPIRLADGTYSDPNPGFYTRAQTVTLDSINIGSGGQITLDPARDDVVISAFSILTNPIAGTVVVDDRFPAGSGENGLPLYGNKVSQFDNARIQALLDPNAPNSGLVLIEIFYNYDMILGLPWITAFVPDPIPLYAYSIMPNPNVEPTPTP
jgi:Flp pilus assembly protein TadG